MHSTIAPIANMGPRPSDHFTPLRFCALPPEIRSMVYGFILSATIASPHAIDTKTILIDGHATKHRCHLLNFQHHQLAILSTNKAIAAEALHVFWSLTFRFLSLDALRYFLKQKASDGKPQLFTNRRNVNRVELCNNPKDAMQSLAAPSAAITHYKREKVSRTLAKCGKRLKLVHLEDREHGECACEGCQDVMEVYEHEVEVLEAAKRFRERVMAQKEEQQAREAACIMQEVEAELAGLEDFM